MLKKTTRKIENNMVILDDYRFHIDGINEKLIAGWVYKTTDDSYAAKVEIRSNSVILFTTKASIERPDLKAAKIGTGQYSFSINPSAIETDVEINAIDIYIDDLKANIEPIELNLPAKTKQKVVKKETTDSLKYRMYIDAVSSEKVVGWVKLKSSTTHRALVELKVGDVALGSDTADEFRLSIKKAGIGDGCYCFKIIPSIHLFPQSTVTCDLYADGVKISNKPIEISVDDKVLEKTKFEHEFSQELSVFGKSVNQELVRLSAEIEKNNGNSSQVAIENIASLSARIEIIEKILIKSFSTK